MAAILLKDISIKLRMLPKYLLILFIFVCLVTRICCQQDSSLTRKLLRGYERLPPPGAITTVELGVYINYFFAISEQSMDYRMSFYLRQNWSDPRLRFNASRNFNKTRLKLEDSQIKDIWIPDVFFRNEKGAGYHFVTQPNRLCYIQSNGYMWYVSKITATFSCPMKLQKYPMDIQYCPLQLESFGYTTESIVFKWIEPKEKAVEFDKTGQEQPESVVNTDVLLEDCSHNDTSGFSDNQIPCLQVNFIVTRPMGYFLIQFYIPSVLLVILSFVSFWISVDAVVARVNIGLMSVLNLVTQSTGSRNQLPKVSYVKAIDVWMTACLVFAFASLIEFAIVNVWSRKEESVRQQTAAQQQQHHQQHHQQHQQHQHNQQQQQQQHPQQDHKSQESQQQQQPLLNPPNFKHQHRHSLLEPPPPPSFEKLPSRFLRRKSEWSSQQGRLFRADKHEIPMVDLDEPPSSFAMNRQRRQSWSGKKLRNWKNNFSRDQPRAQKLDQLSRKLFPLTFLIFNIIYWLIYLA